MASNGADNDELTPWFSFLEEECLSPDGLLCFYDSPRSPRVGNSCEVLGEYFVNPFHDEDQ